MLLLQHPFRTFLWLNRTVQNKLWMRFVPRQLGPCITRYFRGLLGTLSRLATCFLLASIRCRVPISQYINISLTSRSDSQEPNRWSLAHFRSYALNSRHE
ncbi:hypothetical protein CGRA01v4_08663 [Colletotrichum graminicola]|nr:hypothetical protein CGRA01v4_08663 [Colletotrichum graminicola]